MNRRKSINISRAVKESFYGFRTWWFALCAISAVILVSQAWLPKFIFNNVLNQNNMKALKNSLMTVKDKYFATGDPDAAIRQLKAAIFNIYNDPVLSSYMNILMIKVTIILLLLALIFCFLYVSVIIISKNTANTSEIRTELRHNIKKSHLLSGSYFVLCIIKACMLIAPFIVPAVYLFVKFSSTSSQGHTEFHILEFFGVIFITVLLIILSIYLYIRLYFTGFIITEKSANPFLSIIESWKMTDGFCKDITVIFLLTLIIDAFSFISVIGVIPGTGLKYTLRASAYRQCLEILKGKYD